MADLLVRLYDLPPLAPVVDALDRQGIAIRRALATERTPVTAFARMPLACFVATERSATMVDGKAAPVGNTLVGFACYEATCRDFFGPELVHPEARGRGVGKALLLAALHAMRAEGYAYAIIGWASSVDFYKKAVGATVIEGSSPGIYAAPLRSPGS